MTNFKTILMEFEQEQCFSPLNLSNILKKLVLFSAKIPQPGSGQTYPRWQILANVAATDLTLAKWFESHLDALSILHELGHEVDPHKLWAVWAAEGGSNPIRYHDGYCAGIKPWCSAAALVDYGLMTYRDQNVQSQLCILDMQQSTININDEDWHAVGMQSTQTAKISLQHTAVKNVGEPQQYLTRAGFWHGAAGVAACWYGATVRLASFLEQACQEKSNPFRMMYLGKVSQTLAVTRQYFKDVAQQIDQFPDENHELKIRILRAQAELAALTVLEQVGQALGAKPYCENAIFARLAADLPVFIRQSHAAFDLERIGQLALEETSTWTL
ncbi:acyl-CoA dehydrogenase [Acinetobacter puyangensis]|uniref:acyl-CoA dehydrogenase n=1 Tax=Acinetobacter puyangensis TaxID=1096779 RepID=UPI003A4E08AC